ncbi:MAG: glycosyl hydrolase-related protein, partial [Planctomycetota bacterium]|nr:glycosyl hydrolase-related protein [Planctomycetota bacterium]
AYNLPAPIAPPFAISGAIIATAWKLAEDGKGWILRLQEIAGKGTRVEIDFGRECEVTPSDLLERPQAPAQRLRVFCGRLHKHGIMTLRLA